MSDRAPSDRYKWLALSNTTLGMLMAAINGSITLIALPDIFDGIHLNPLLPSSTGYLLWMLMGFMVVTAVLVVTLGRIGDMYGRVRMYNLGFAVFTVFSILLSVTWLTGTGAALYLIGMRVGQGIGAACLMANSGAILTDAFPESERGMAIGINAIAMVVGSFVGLILGGLLAPVEWRLVFLVSVPFGCFGTVWAYLKLRDQGVRAPAPIDWWGNATFAVGLVGVLAGITYGIMPYGHHTMGWTNPKVLAALIGGVVVLGVFGVIETRVAHPMFDLKLFRIRAFTGGNFAGFLGALGRGGLMFMLILWLQGCGCRSTATRSPGRPCGLASTCSRSLPACCSPLRWPAGSRTASGPAPLPRAACSSPLSGSCCSRCCRWTSPTCGSPWCCS
jgi:MFS family permease